MSDDAHTPAKEIFGDALERPPGERDAFVDAACGADDSLRRRVLELLAAHANAGRFLASPTRTTPGDGAASASAALRPGDTLGDRFRIVALAGRGGMGDVYRAEDLTLGQTVALKLLPEPVSEDPDRLARLREEVRVARQVTHPNVCRVYDIGEAGGRHFLSMEWIDGEDLASVLRTSGRPPADRALSIAAQLCAGLAAAHESRVVHRDLKPANVMIDLRGIARITDFGLAEAGAEIRGERAREGTPQYMAPEQVGGTEASFASDLYSLGLVLYELFTGGPCFGGTTLDEVMRRRGQPLAPPSRVAPDIDRRVEKLILRCLEDDPERRPPSARAVFDALPRGDAFGEAMTEAQRRADRIAAFRAEAAELGRAGILPIAAQDLVRVEAYHERVLGDLVQRFDVDVSERGKQLSLGMRAVTLVGAIALAASVYYFFFRIWGGLATAAQVAVLTAAPMLGLAATSAIAKRDRSRYFTLMAGTAALALMIVATTTLCGTFNLAPSWLQVLGWGLLAVLVAYTYRLRLLLAAAIVALVAFVAGAIHRASGGFWPEFIVRPESWFPGALALVPLVLPLRALRRGEFGPVYRVAGIAFLAAPAVLLGANGSLSYLPYEPRGIEIAYQLFGFAASGTAIGIGIGRRRADAVYTGTIFFVALLFVEFFDWWWAWMPKYLFFLIVAATALAVALALRRLRATIAARPAEETR